MLKTVAKISKTKPTLLRWLGVASADSKTQMVFVSKTLMVSVIKKFRQMIIAAMVKLRRVSK
jgi:hypothetical protein